MSVSCQAFNVNNKCTKIVKIVTKNVKLVMDFIQVSLSNVKMVKRN